MNAIPMAGSVALAKSTYGGIKYAPTDARYIRHGKAMTQ